MTLRAYLKKKNLTQEAFAEKAGISQPSVSRYLDGTERSIPIDIAMRIRDVTGGKVKIDDLVAPDGGTARLKKATT